MLSSIVKSGSTVGEKTSTISPIDLLFLEIPIPEPETSLAEKYKNDISNLADSLHQIFVPHKSGLREHFDSSTQNVNPALMNQTQYSQVTQRVQPSYTPYMYYPASQCRIFTTPNTSLLNYPVIPRSRDRARLRRMQTEISAFLPADLPSWSVRSRVPTVPQPDWTEEGQYLLYEGFSLQILQAYLNALDLSKVRQIPIPYDDAEMKSALVEAGVLSEEAAEALIDKNGQESWRGPMEGREDEKYREEMSSIMGRSEDRL